jgi:hypothetical protein
MSDVEAVRRSAAKQKPPGFAGRFFRLAMLIVYSPLPKRRDHHPARRGWPSSLAAEAGSAGAGADGSGWLRLTGAAASGRASTRKLTFSRTVDRRRAALSAS